MGTRVLLPTLYTRAVLELFLDLWGTVEVEGVLPRYWESVWMGCGLVSILERLVPLPSSPTPIFLQRIYASDAEGGRLLVRLGRRRRTPSVLALSTEHGENENTIRNALIEPRKKNKPIMCMCNCMRFSLLLNVYHLPFCSSPSLYDPARPPLTPSSSSPVFPFCL